MGDWPGDGPRCDREMGVRGEEGRFPMGGPGVAVASRDKAEIDIAGRHFKDDLHPVFARLRAEAPVCRLRFPGKLPTWMVTRYDDVVALLKDERFLKDWRAALTPEQAARVPWIPKAIRPLERNMLDRDPPDHTRLRALVQKAFTPRLVENLRGRVQEITDELSDAAAGRGRIELMREFALPLPSIVIAELLGIPARDRHRFHRWSTAMLTTPGTTWGMIRLLPTVMAFMRYLRKLIAARHARPSDDLAGALVQAREANDALSDDELMAMFVLLLIAGHETTVNLIGNGMLALLRHPDQLDRLREDPALIKPGIEELLRYDGALLARLEGQIAITTLLRRLPDLRLDAPPGPLPHRPGALLNGLEALPLTFARRKGSERSPA